MDMNDESIINNENEDPKHNEKSPFDFDKTLGNSEEKQAEKITTLNNMDSFKNEHLLEHDSDYPSLRQMLPDFDSIFPDALLIHVLHRSGINGPSEMCARILGIAMQKVVADIINDAYVLTEMRAEAHSGDYDPSSFVLTQDIIKEVLNHRGIYVNPFQQ